MYGKSDSSAHLWSVLRVDTNDRLLTRLEAQLEQHRRERFAARYCLSV